LGRREASPWNLTLEVTRKKEKKRKASAVDFVVFLLMGVAFSS
jgi:hypothetical protein